MQAGTQIVPHIENARRLRRTTRILERGGLRQLKWYRATAATHITVYRIIELERVFGSARPSPQPSPRGRGSQFFAKTPPSEKAGGPIALDSANGSLAHPVLFPP